MRFRVLRKREQQNLEAAQMKFFRALLGITRLEKQKNKSIREKLETRYYIYEMQNYEND